MFLKTTLPLLVTSLLLALTACDSLEKTDLVKRDTIMQVKDQTLMYEMYLTGLDKYRYNYFLVNGPDTTQLFEAKLTDETANNLGMEVEKIPNGIRINLDKPIDNQQKTVDGVTYELQGTR